MLGWERRRDGQDGRRRTAAYCYHYHDDDNSNHGPVGKLHRAIATARRTGLVAIELPAARVGRAAVIMIASALRRVVCRPRERVGRRCAHGWWPALFVLRKNSLIMSVCRWDLGSLEAKWKEGWKEGILERLVERRACTVVSMYINLSGCCPDVRPIFVIPTPPRAQEGPTT